MRQYSQGGRFGQMIVALFILNESTTRQHKERDVLHLEERNQDRRKQSPHKLQNKNKSMNRQYILPPLPQK